MLLWQPETCSPRRNEDSTTQVEEESSFFQQKQNDAILELVNRNKHK